MNKHRIEVDEHALEVWVREAGTWHHLHMVWGLFFEDGLAVEPFDIYARAHKAERFELAQTVRAQHGLL